MKSAVALLLAVLLCLSLLPAVSVSAAGSDISSQTQYSSVGFSSCDFLKNGNIKDYRSAPNASVTLKNDSGIGGLYLLFDLEFGPYTIKDNTSGKTAQAGALGMLHEYIDLKALFGDCPTSVTLDFTSGDVRLSEIYALSPGTPPDFVQQWQKPLDGGADLVLFSTHGDDDQLFFAGLLPYYATYKNYRVQVVYLTDHRNMTKERTHEMLNGLWKVGVTAYPVFAPFPDFRIDDLQKTYQQFEKLGYSFDTLQGFVVEQIRRFRPLVAVGHDLNGEYGHGMHKAYADLLTKALPLAKDPTAYPDSAAKYGTWDISKLYLHLYEENPIVMDFDQPQECFGGLSAFQVTQKYGFPCHESQQWTWFKKWLNGAKDSVTIHKASQIQDYNPCRYGLYYTTVGPDTGINDMFEHITPYAEQERLEAERLEAERQEQERLEAERLEQERLEQERLEQERLEQERLEAEQAKNETASTPLQKDIIAAGIGLLLLISALVIVLILMKRQKSRRNKNSRP